MCHRVGLRCAQGRATLLVNLLGRVFLRKLYCGIVAERPIDLMTPSSISRRYWTPSAIGSATISTLSLPGTSARTPVAERTFLLTSYRERTTRHGLLPEAGRRARPAQPTPPKKQNKALTTFVVSAYAAMNAGNRT